GLFPDEEYNRQRKLLEMELESLVVPGANAAEEAGKLIMNLKDLWAEAKLEEQRKLLLTMLDAIYVDAKQTKSVVAIKPKPPFIPIFQVAVTKGGSSIHIINEPLRTQSGSPSVFLVETGEGRTIPAQRFIGAWLDSYVKYTQSESPLVKLRV
ncbi:MAG: recombinase family protein, partial [Dehalococcoidales bacterium]|nr:recombinase family protein [Dehalococcoidales bacterium]